MHVLSLPLHDDPATARAELRALFGEGFDDAALGDWNLAAAFRRARVPPLNVCERADGWTVFVPLPGLLESAIGVQRVGDELRIHGERASRGAFDRSVRLPADARGPASGVRAVCKRGVLEITLPKPPPRVGRRSA